MIKSRFLDSINKFFEYSQNKLENISKNSNILGKIDEMILIFISLTLITSTFLQSEKIAIFALFTIFLTIVKLLTKKGTKIQLTQWDIAIFVYLSICIASTINSTLLSQSIHGLLKTVIYISYYYCISNYFLNNTSKIKYIFWLVGILCSFEGIIAVLQNLSGVEQISTWQDTRYINPEDAIARAYGTLKPYNPNLLGGYLIAGIPYIIGSAALFLTDKKIKLFTISSICFLICSMAIFLTGSRGAYLGLMGLSVALIIIAGLIIKTDFAQNDKLKSLYKKFITSLSAIFALILILVPKITKRILSIFILRGDSSTSFRMNVYNSSWQMFCDNWILGIGAGNQTFREIYGLYMLTGYDALSTYSVPLEIAVESGLLGLIAFFAFIVLFIINITKILLKICPNGLSDKIIISIAILTITGVMTHGLFDTIYFRPQVQFVFWTIIAMATSIIINNKQKQT